jgi:hypothetical protein
MGCESGIVLRESAERDDASRNIDLLGTDAIPFGTAIVDDSGGEDAAATPVQKLVFFFIFFRWFIEICKNLKMPKPFTIYIPHL